VRDLVAGVPAGSLVVTSNSMPVRDLDSFVPAGTPLGFLGNRGASGIDGIPSTALGCATQTDVPVVVFTGDLALLHDVGGLLAGQRAGVHLTVVCIDNDGGAIFSMLPIHQQAEAVDYETLFRTRHGVDLAELDGLAGVRVHTVDAGDDLAELVAECVQRTTPGVDVVLVTIEPDGDMALRRACRDAVNETAGS
jgi:2-succinyl-5-enolpyruvyl-6-hydroxy-3-cyclohexene-1-carboxylate synthase